jgi:CBS domain-containing protein
MTKRLYVADVTVGSLMTRPVVSVRPDTTFAALTALMEEPAVKAIQLAVDHRLRTIPVVEDSPAGTRLVGVVTRRDLTRALID